MCNYNSFLKDSIFRNKNKYKLKGHNKHFKKIFFKYNSSLNTIFFKCNGKEKQKNRRIKFEKRIIKINYFLLLCNIISINENKNSNSIT